MRYQHSVYSNRMCRNHQVHISHWLAFSFQRGPQFSILFSGSRIPGQHFHMQQELFHRNIQALRFTLERHTKPQFSFAHNRNPNVRQWYAHQPLKYTRNVPLDYVTRGVGIQKITDRHLEEISLLRRFIAAVGHEIFGNVNGLH